MFSLCKRQGFPSCFTKSDVDSPKNKSGSPIKNIQSPLSIHLNMMSSNMVQNCCFPLPRHQNRWFPAQNHAIHRTCCGLRVLSQTAWCLPRTFPRKSPPRTAMTRRRKWISDGFGTWTFDIYAHLIAILAGKINWPIANELIDVAWPTIISRSSGFLMAQPGLSSESMRSCKGVMNFIILRGTMNFFKTNGL